MTPRANVLRLAFTGLRRDWRSGELRLITAALIIAVASTTSVTFFTDRVRLAMEHQATELLGADLVIRSASPIEDELLSAGRGSGLDETRTTSFRSVVVAGDRLELSEVKAVEAGYPLRGTLRTARALFSAEQPVHDIPAPGSAWADSRLLQALGIAVGDVVELGEARLTVSRVLTYEPDRGGDLFNIAPRLLMNRADVEATGLLLPGSRVAYRLLLSGNVDAIAAFRAAVEARGDRDLRVQDIRDARPELKRALERSDQFFGLAMLVSIALAGLAIAMAAQRYAARHLDHCAIMRCLGAGQRTIVAIYLAQLVILALAAGLAGSAIGFLVQEGLAGMIAGVTQGSLPSPSLRPLAGGVLLGIVVTAGFALPQVLRLRSVPPLRVLRRDLAPVGASGYFPYAVAVMTLAALTPWRSGNLSLNVYTFLGILGTAIVLVLGARLLIHYLGRFRSGMGISFRFGLANIARRASISVAQVLGIGVGVMVLLLLTLVRVDLLEGWRNKIPPGAPNAFLINIQPGEVPDLRAFLGNMAEGSTELYPMVRARLTHINGREVDPDAYDEPRAQRLAAREFNLSWAGTMPEANSIVAGEWWGDDAAPGVQYSVEDGIAEELGISLDDELTYNVAGEDITGTVTSLRRVDWDSFHVNFFVILNPGVLEDKPATYITSFYLPPSQRPRLVDLVRTFPSVTVIDVDAILVQVKRIMDQAIRTVEFVFVFTLLAGFLVMVAALQTTHDERIRESALFSALGAGRRQILNCLMAELATLGLVAGFIAAFAATVMEVVLARFVFRLDVIVNPWVWVAGPALCCAMVLACGFVGTRRAIYTPPVVALRGV